MVTASKFYCHPNFVPKRENIQYNWLSVGPCHISYQQICQIKFKRYLSEKFKTGTVEFITSIEVNNSNRAAALGLFISADCMFLLPVYSKANALLEIKYSDNSHSKQRKKERNRFYFVQIP